MKDICEFMTANPWWTLIYLAVIASAIRVRIKRVVGK